MKVFVSSAAVILLFVFIFCHSVYSQQPATSGAKDVDVNNRGQNSISNSEEILQQIQELKKGQDDIRKQLEEIVRLLKQQLALGATKPDVKGVAFDLGKHPVKGSETATLTLIEFTDYQCPYCSKYFRETYPQIEQSYIETGKLRYVKFDTPLEGIHKLAFKAALATHCADEQGKYWDMDRRLFENQGSLEPFRAHAEVLGLEVTKFEDCMAIEKYAATIHEDTTAALKVGARGTPSFLLAEIDPGDPSKVIGIQLMRGALPFSAFKIAIDQALSQPRPAK